MARGRQKEPSQGPCPKCHKPGYPFDKYVPRNDSRDLYFYPWYRHEDGSKDCNLESKALESGPTLGIVQEYGRQRIKNEVTDFHYFLQPKSEILDQYPLKETHVTKAWPVVIYYLSCYEVPNFSGICKNCKNRMVHVHDLKCPDCNNQTIVWCPKCKCHRDFSELLPLSKIYTDRQNLNKELTKSGVNILELEDIDWFLGTKNKITFEAFSFLTELKEMHSTRGIIVTFGDNAFSVANKLSNKFKCETEERKDKYGILDKVKKKIDKKDKLSGSCEAASNKATRTLADPKDYPSE